MNHFKKHKKLYLLIFITIFLILGTFLLSFYIVNKNKEKNKKEKITLLNYLNNNSNLNFKTLWVGMTFGIVFGFIDNAGLWFGLHSLEKYIPGGLLEKSGWGNTYSNVFGVSVGTFISIIFRTYIPISNIPVWTNTIGVLIGCILGIYIPKFIIMFFN